VATILLVGVDLFFRGKLDVLLDGHKLTTADSVDPPDLVIVDLARVDAYEVAETYADVPIIRTRPASGRLRQRASTGSSCAPRSPNGHRS
jgi:hypothetical protein